jgi:hypothetical protein
VNLKFVSIALEVADCLLPIGSQYILILAAQPLVYLGRYF